MITDISIAAFLRRRIPSLQNMGNPRETREAMIRLVNWHEGRGSLAVIGDQRIEAVGLARPILKAEDSLVPRKFDELGEILYLEHVASRGMGATRALFQFVLWRWPYCRKVMFRRMKSREPYKIHPMKPFMRKFGVVC